MNYLIGIIYTSARKVCFVFLDFLNGIYNYLLLRVYDIKTGRKFTSNGIPFIRVSKNGSFEIGNNFRINNGNRFNPIGRNQRCMFIVKGRLTIGNNVKMSSTAIVCHNEVIIEDGVTIGGNVVIYDTDFHSINHIERNSIPENKNNVKTSPVHIKKNVFIGAHTTILKGVTIGENAVIGACSVIRNNIPANEIWIGNPAIFKKRIDE